MFHQVFFQRDRKLDFQEVQGMNEGGKLSTSREMDNECINFSKTTRFPDRGGEIKKSQLVQ